MKFILYLFLLLNLSCSTHSGTRKSSQEWLKPNGKLKVLSTIAMIDDIVSQVGGEYVDSISLIRGELDPHTYQLVKGDDEKLAFASLIFYNGLGLEHGPSLQQYLSQNSKAAGLGNFIFKSHPELILKEKGQVDPHIWMDISLWSQIVPQIVQELSLKDPLHREEYEKNGQMLLAKMKQAHHEVLTMMQQIPQERRYLVTSHDAFNYFGRAYLAEDNERQNDGWRSRIAAPEGLAPESQLSAADIQNILDHVAKYRIPVLFPESNVSKDSLKKIIQAGNEKGLKIRIANVYLYADAMGEPGSDGDSYLKMIHHNAKIINENLTDHL